MKPRNKVSIIQPRKKVIAKKKIINTGTVLLSGDGDKGGRGFFVSTIGGSSSKRIESREVKTRFGTYTEFLCPGEPSSGLGGDTDETDTDYDYDEQQDFFRGGKPPTAFGEDGEGCLRCLGKWHRPLTVEPPPVQNPGPQYYVLCGCCYIKKKEETADCARCGSTKSEVRRKCCPCCLKSSHIDKNDKECQFNRIVNDPSCLSPPEPSVTGIKIRRHPRSSRKKRELAEDMKKLSMKLEPVEDTDSDIDTDSHTDSDMDSDMDSEWDWSIA